MHIYDEIDAEYDSFESGIQGNVIIDEQQTDDIPPLVVKPLKSVSEQIEALRVELERVNNKCNNLLKTRDEAIHSGNKSLVTVEETKLRAEAKVKESETKIAALSKLNTDLHKKIEKMMKKVEKVEPEPVAPERVAKPSLTVEQRLDLLESNLNESPEPEVQEDFQMRDQTRVISKATTGSLPKPSSSTVVLDRAQHLKETWQKSDQASELASVKTKPKRNRNSTKTQSNTSPN
jgi:hypothetical protein